MTNRNDTHLFFINAHACQLDLGIRMNLLKHDEQYLVSQQQSNFSLNLFLKFFFGEINFFTDEFLIEFNFPCERLESLETLSSRSRDVTPVAGKFFVERLADVLFIVDGTGDV